MTTNNDLEKTLSLALEKARKVVEVLTCGQLKIEEIMVNTKRKKRKRETMERRGG
jgi:hypothetical protein